MSQKQPSPKPVWWKNTYFWISAILLILAIIGLPMFGGDAAIRDPGQKPEGRLWVLYGVAAVVMFLGGYISHAQTVQAYNEETKDESNG